MKSPDTDSLHFVALRISVEGHQNIIRNRHRQQRLISIGELAVELGPERCTTLMAPHAYSECDATICSKGIGKVKPIKVMEKAVKLSGLFSKLGNSWMASRNVVKELDAFTCALYGKNRLTSVDSACHAKTIDLYSSGIVPTTNINMGALPPCRKSLLEHIKSVNYQLGIKGPSAIVPTINIDMGTLPPCRKSLLQHVKSVNYQLVI